MQIIVGQPGFVAIAASEIDEQPVWTYRRRRPIGVTIFARRSFDRLVSNALPSRFSVLQQRLGAPHDLMMLRRRRDDHSGDDIYLGLPHKKLLAAFPGFVEVEREELPNFLSPLVVRQDRFAELFPDIAAKVECPGSPVGLGL
jgi:hypothetical protein